MQFSPHKPHNVPERFAASVAKVCTTAVGRTEGTELTAFTDGCPGLRSILADAGVAELPILDCWCDRSIHDARRSVETRGR